MPDSNTVIPGCGYHHVALRVADFDATLRFYIDGLGFRKAVEWGEGDRRACLMDTGDGNYLEVFARRTVTSPSRGLEPREAWSRWNRRASPCSGIPPSRSASPSAKDRTAR
jgi:catechol 2,3-dioxygenase-like lactoylglutathione lyase family enzyme